jgi:hypothetical protein
MILVVVKEWVNTSVLINIINKHVINVFITRHTLLTFSPFVFCPHYVHPIHIDYPFTIALTLCSHRWTPYTNSSHHPTTLHLHLIACSGHRLSLLPFTRTTQVSLHSTIITITSSPHVHSHHPTCPSSYFQLGVI